MSVIDHLPDESGFHPTESSFLPPQSFLVEAAPSFPPGSQILDYGSGSGRASVYLADRGHWVVAVDIDHASLVESQRLLRGVGGPAARNVVQVQGDLEGPMFKPGSLDVVVSSFALQCLKKDRAATVLENFQALTRPGGLNLVTAYIGTPEQQRQKPGYNLYEPGQIKAIYQAAGWEILSEEEELRQLDHYLVKGVARTSVSSKSNILARKPEHQVTQRTAERQRLLDEAHAVNQRMNFTPVQ